MKKRVMAPILALALLFVNVLPVEALDAAKAGKNEIISAGSNNIAVVDETGVLWMTGLDFAEQHPSQVPVEVMSNVSAVSVSFNNYAVIKTDGSLWMWGDNTFGQLGNATLEASTTPIKIMDDVVFVVAKNDCTAAIKSDGSLWIWGVTSDYSVRFANVELTNPAYYYNKFGNAFLCQTIPLKVMEGVAAVALGNDVTLALKTDGSLWSWGTGALGQIGKLYSSEPIKVMEDVIAVSAGGAHAGALKSDGTLWMWGSNRDGQLGNGGKGNSKASVSKAGNTIEYATQSGPIQVMENVAAIDLGYDYTAALKMDGTLWAWGYNATSQVGNGGAGDSTALYHGAFKDDFLTATIQSTPVKVLDCVAYFSAGEYSTAALKTDGTFWTWGANDNGQLGNGGGGDMVTSWGVVYQSTPVQVSLSTKMNLHSSAQAISSADLHITHNGVEQVFTDVNGVPVLPLTYQGTTYLPVRAVAGLVGLQADWDASTETVLLTTGTGSVEQYSHPGSPSGRTGAVTATLNRGMKVTLDGTVQTFQDANGQAVYPIVYNGTTYLPVRAMSGLVGLSIEWDGATNTVKLTEK